MFLKMTLLSILMIPTISLADPSPFQRHIIELMRESFFVGCISRAVQTGGNSAAAGAQKDCKAMSDNFAKELSTVKAPAQEEDLQEDEDTTVASIRKFVM